MVNLTATGDLLVSSGGREAEKLRWRWGRAWLAVASGGFLPLDGIVVCVASFAVHTQRIIITSLLRSML